MKLLRIVLFPLLGASLALHACSGDNPSPWQGYVEGEYVYVAAPAGGRLERLAVARGDQVREGDLLFHLDDAPEQARLAEAEAALERAQSTLNDLEKGLRPSEIAVIEARLDKAMEAERLAEVQMRRQRELLAKKSSSQEAFDQARSAHIQAGRMVDELRAELATARLGGRADAVEASRAAVRTAEAVVKQAGWNLEQKKQYAPADSLVFDTIHTQGEWVAAGRPVLSLLPPEGRKIRFYVPENTVAILQQGQKLLVMVDGLEKPLIALITYVSPQAEYTPPVIYSSQSRAKLVFLVEAALDPSSARLLNPGQPVDVVPEASENITARKRGT